MSHLLWGSLDKTTHGCWLFWSEWNIHYFIKERTRSAPFSAENQTSALSEQTPQQPGGEKKRAQNSVQSQPHPHSQNSFSKCMTCCRPFARGRSVCLQAAFHTVNIFTLIPREETRILQVCEIYMSWRERLLLFFVPCWIFTIASTASHRRREHSLVADMKLSALIKIWTSLTCRDSAGTF